MYWMETMYWGSYVPVYEAGEDGYVDACKVKYTSSDINHWVFNGRFAENWDEETYFDPEDD